MAMIRLQEFYESPYPNIQGKYFDLITYADAYIIDFKDFDYFTEFVGFNVPDWAILKFITVYAGKFNWHETVVLDALQCVIELPRFYLVVCSTMGRVYKHEIAHALWYMDPTYQEAQKAILRKYSLKKYKTFVKKKGYAEHVLDDEIQAYASTSSDFDLRDEPINRKAIIEFRDVFNTRFKEMKKWEP